MISKHQQTRLTYEQLDLESNAVARGLQKLGVKKGDRVAVSLGNNIEFATVGGAVYNMYTRVLTPAAYICAFQTRCYPCTLISLPRLIVRQIQQR